LSPRATSPPLPAQTRRSHTAPEPRAGQSSIHLSVVCGLDHRTS
jgi:hypothetical protein